MENGSTINNSGTWDIQNDSFVYLYTGNSNTFNNTGTFQKSGGTSTTTTSGVYGTDGTFKNSGQVLAKAGTLNFLGTFIQTAGTTSLAGGSIATAVNPLSVLGGAVIGSGTITGGINNTGGMVAPGTTTPAVTNGTIAIGTSTAGNYTQGATGAFNVKIGGTGAGQFDSVTLSGTATLAGALNVSLINAFSPAVGNSFTILTAASVSGTFSSTNLPALPTGLGWKVTYTATTVVLSVVTVSSAVANLSPGSLPFPNTIVNTSATVQKAQLQNTGTAPLLITSIQPTGPDAANYSYTVDATQPCPISPAATLGVGATCMLDIGFLPLTAGTHNNAQITVTDNSGNVTGSTQTIALSGTGIVLSSIAVTPSTATIPQGNSLQFTATGTYSDSSTQNLTTQVTWASATTSVSTINAGGLAQGLTPGTSNITAKQGAVTSPAAVLTVTGAKRFVVSAPGSAIAGTAFNVSVFAEDQFGNVVPGYTGTVHFTSTDGSAVLPANSTLTNGSGLFQFTLKTLGSQTITAMDTVTSSITGTSNTITVGSGAATHFLVTAPGGATAGTSFNISVTALDQFNNVATGYTGTVHFTSTDGTATLPANTTLTSGTGNFAVTLKTTGSQTVTATDTVTSGITGISGAILVTAVLQTITVAPAATSVSAGLTQPFTATGHFSDGTTGAVSVNWTSSDTTIATINAAGVATGVKPGGPVTITATSTTNAAISGTAQLTVTAATLQTITVAPTSASISAGLTQPFTATGHFSDGTSGVVAVNWTSSNTTIATINASGVATGVKAGGPVTITATSTANAAISGTAQLTVTAATLQTITVAPTSASVTAGLTQPFTATGHFSDGTTGAVSVNWTSSDNTIATINSSGVATGVKAGGPVTITATSTANAAISGTAQLTVTAATLQTITVAPTSASVTAGLTQPFTATGHFSDGTSGAVSVNWTSANTTIATINASGVATGVKAGGPITITATSTANAAISGTAQLTVTAATLQTITVAPTSTTVAAGLTQPFTATGHFSDGTTGAVSVNWTSSDNTIATINAAGVATGVKAGGPITITATSGNIFGTAQLTVTPVVITTFPLNVTLIGTGTGSVTDNLGSIDCVNTAGKITGTCTANYPVGTVVMLTANPTAPSTFGGWLQACSGTGGCSITMNSAQSVTASFVPPPKMIPVPFTPGTNATGMATYDCPSNPNPSPGNPCLDPNAHATSLTIGQVITPFTLTVVSTEIPPTNGDGICTNGLTPTQDFDCRFKSFFNFLAKPNGDTIVPLCDPYANGNCVVYSVYFQNPGQEPDPSMYVGPINWNITYNNGTFVPPAPWTGSTPRLYYDPSSFVMPNSPYGTDCTTPMLIGNPGVATNPAIFCQFVFDITTVFDATKKVDPLIGGKSKIFSDVVVAFPPIFAPVVTVTTTPDAATVTAGNPIGFTIAVSNSALAVANNVSLSTPLPGGTNVNWTISPAYAGPGTCAITGPVGSQVLNCAFGTLNQSTSLSLHIQSASSAAGTTISPSTVTVGTEQLLSIGSIVVQPITVMFSGLTASQMIPVGTSSINLGGVIGNGTQFAPSGEKVSITINGVTQQATVGSNGVFSLQFPTAGIPASATPYPITYSYAGDSLLSTAKDSSTTLTVNTGGEPVLTFKPLGSGTQNGSFYEDLQVTNTGTGVARNATINALVFRTLTGTGMVTVNTALFPALPDNFGSLNVGASTIVRIYLNVPAGVTGFLMTENGNVSDVASKTFAYSSSQVISY